MSPVKKLSYEDLLVSVNIQKFKDTSEIKPSYKLVGQDRALKALEFGLSMRYFGYNIFVSGSDGIGRKKYIVEYIKKRARREETPSDWCYVFNFKDQYKPIAIELKPGTANDFKYDIDNLIDEIIAEVPEYFSSEECEKKKADLTEYYEKIINSTIETLNEKAKEKNLVFKNTVEGFAFVPLNKEKKEMTEQEYNDLLDEEKDEINDNVNELKSLAYEIIRKTRSVRKEMNEKIRDLESSLSTLYLDKKIDPLIEKYSYNKKIEEYLKEIKSDIIENIDIFIEIEGVDKEYLESFLNRYQVNVFICNDKKGVPVIIEEIPELNKLLGNIEYENRSGNLVTDFTMIQPGSLHKANGGYIIIEARKLLENYWSYEALKRMLILKKIVIESIKSQFDLIPLVTLKPEPIPLNLKVILIGDTDLYYLLYTYDEDFKKLFKIKADFNEEFEDIKENVKDYLSLIKYIIDEKIFLNVTYEGIIELIKYSKTLIENKNRLSSNISTIITILEQANQIAKDNKKNFIDEIEIKNVINFLRYRNGLIKDKILDMYRNGKYLVDVKGFKVGEINALSVIGYGDIEIGKQNKVTVNTYSGNGGVINIEREVGLSGNIFNKAVLILNSYICEKFAQETGVSFGASICFEQMYGEIDGDSATLAETLALLSSLSDIPINQGIAVTGSVNQKGEVQAVGGVNTKIEGYFSICKLFGLDGTQGVIIPSTNVDDLVLNEEILEAVKENKFSIYSVDRVEDCFDIILQENFKKGRKHSNFDLIQEKVIKKLEKFKGVNKDKSKKE